MTLVTLEAAKLHVHVTDPARDAEVLQYLEQASAAIVEYIGSRADPAWDETTAPDIVQAATLKLLAHFWRHRGDDAADDHDTAIWQALSALLMRTRDPALA